eukprot:2946135-Pleurochrysis_carterae.AAC.1
MARAVEILTSEMRNVTRSTVSGFAVRWSTASDTGPSPACTLTSYAVPGCRPPTSIELCGCHGPTAFQAFWPTARYSTTRTEGRGLPSSCSEMVTQKDVVVGCRLGGSTCGCKGSRGPVAQAIGSERLPQAPPANSNRLASKYSVSGSKSSSTNSDTP